MTKQFLPKLKAFNTVPYLWDSFIEKLDYDIEQQQRKLEQASELSDVFKAQGAIAALRQLKYLKDEVNAIK
jgi:division protein CdvB (Snf7/Vps24/ESCRT-III family)